MLHKNSLAKMKRNTKRLRGIIKQFQKEMMCNYNVQLDSKLFFTKEKAMPLVTDALFTM